MSEKLKSVATSLSEKEKLAAIIWLIIGITQCLSIVLFISGAWNIYASISRFKQAKSVLQPWPGIVQAYDKWQSSIIIAAVINLIFGGVYGIIGCAYDYFVIRKYVLDNKAVFEEAGL